MSHIALDVLDEMIAEAEHQPRYGPKPLLGGGKAAPFDGEEMGRLLRVEILRQVRTRMTAEGVGCDEPPVSILAALRAHPVYGRYDEIIAFIERELGRLA